MAFATVNDIGVRLGRDLTAGEQTSVALLLDMATAVIATEAGEDDAWAAGLNPVPQILRVVCIEAVDRAMANPNGLDSLQETIGQTSYSARFREYGLMLTDWERTLVRAAVGGTSSGSALVDSIVGPADAVA